MSNQINESCLCGTSAFNQAAADMIRWSNVDNSDHDSPRTGNLLNGGKASLRLVANGLEHPELESLSGNE